MSIDMVTTQGEVIGVDSATALTRAEIDIAISTAKSYPRSISRFESQLDAMVNSVEVAETCNYALPREGKTIEGPTARLAEMVMACYGNVRAGARIIEVSDRHLTAQGVFHDLENNNMVTVEVRRGIVGRNGRRYSDDMVNTTANAAMSIVLRNVVFKGVPRFLWGPAYDKAMALIEGNDATLTPRRDAAIEYLQRKHAVGVMRVCLALGVASRNDITLEHLRVLKGTLTAIKDGDTTAAQAFPAARPPEAGGGHTQAKGVAILEGAVAEAKAEPKAEAKVTASA